MAVLNKENLMKAFNEAAKYHEHKIQNPTDATKENICDIARSSIDANFEAGGRWDGNANDINIMSGGSMSWSDVTELYGYVLERNNFADTKKATLARSNLLQDSISVVPMQGKTGIIAGANMPYARIHQLGGTYTVRITNKSRKFFWAMYYKSKNEREKEIWRAMALTKKSSFTVTMPPRPYLVVSEEDVQGIIQALGVGVQS